MDVFVLVLVLVLVLVCGLVLLSLLGIKAANRSGLNLLVRIFP